MKVRISPDNEYWPFSYIKRDEDSTMGIVVNVPKDTVEKWERVLKELDEIQDEMNFYIEQKELQGE